MFMLLLLQVNNFFRDLNFLYEYLISQGFIFAGLYSKNSKLKTREI